MSNSGTKQIIIFLNNGNRTFVYHVSYSTDSRSPYAIGVGDFNPDNLPNIILFLGYDNGLFSSMLSFQLEYDARPLSAIIGDFNNDHKLDMAVLNNGADSLNIFLRTC